MRKISYSVLCSLCVCSVVSSMVVSAQEAAPPATNPYEKRVNDLREDIVKVSKDIDDGVESILDLIIPLTDTEDTGNKVTQMKQATIESLRKAIDFYVAERQKLEGDLARPAAPLTKPQLAGQVEAIDAEVDQRVNDILRVSASLAENQEFDKYEYNYDSFNEVYNRRVTDEYKQNQKVQRRVVDTRGNLSDELKKSIASLKDRLSRYQRTLSYQSTPANTEAIQSLIADTEARIKAREQHLMSLGDTSGDAGTRAIGEGDFKVISEMLNDQKAEVRASFDLLRRLKGEYDAALVRMNNARRMGH